MGYNKYIAYGKTFELYEYEKEILFNGRSKATTRDRSKVLVDHPDMDSNGVLGLQQKTLQTKRQDNSHRATLAFKRLILSNLDRVETPLLVTLTYAQNQKDISIGYRDFRSFIQTCRYRYGSLFKYISVPEFQKRGAVHFHSLFWGLPFELLLQERTSYNLSPSLSECWSLGYVYLKKTDGNEKLSTYLSKYMSKAFIDPKLKYHKAYTTSRNIKRPIIQGGFSPVWPVVSDWVGDKSPCKVKEYHTQYLGKGRLSVYNLE